jgi:hypothetical protein
VGTYPATPTVHSLNYLSQHRDLDSTIESPPEEELPHPAGAVTATDVATQVSRVRRILGAA